MPHADENASEEALIRARKEMACSDCVGSGGGTLSTNTRTNATSLAQPLETSDSSPALTPQMLSPCGRLARVHTIGS